MEYRDCPLCDEQTLVPTRAEPRGVKVYCCSCGYTCRINAAGALIHANVERISADAMALSVEISDASRRIVESQHE
jgi:hypothetical protein